MLRLRAPFARSGLLALACCFVFAACAAPTGGENAAGGVATYGGGNPYDALHPGEVESPDLAKADANAYVVPTDLPPLESPRVVVSLEGQTIELIDDATGFHKVYPVGVGAKGPDGKSYTPTGDYATGPDPSDGWFYYKRRYHPSYFDGLPFLRTTIKNSQGAYTYGFHGPITHPLHRGFVSHGCMRMRAHDIVEMFYLLIDHPSTPIHIQTAKRYDADGNLIDVTPPDQDPVAAYQAGQAPAPTASQATDFSAQPSATIPDDDPTGITSTIDVPDGGTITKLSVSVDIQHNYPTDLEVSLEHAGQSVVLVDHDQGTSYEGIRATFDVSAFDGLAAGGSYVLHVADTVPVDQGTLSDWSFTLTR